MAVEKVVGAALLAFALAISAGCATSRSEVDVRVPVLETSQAINSNGKKVSISSVDERAFELKPRQASIPSLKNGEINDPGITQRAIARKRNGWGRGLGDVLLPSGRHVSGLVRDAVAEGYRQAGYQVVADSSSNDATKVKVRVIEFWSWLQPGAFSVSVNNKSKLLIETDGQPAVEVVTGSKESRQMVTDGTWKQITEAALQDITQETRKGL